MPLDPQVQALLEELKLAGTSVRACPGGELRVELWRDAAGRPRRVVRSLAGPPGARTADLSYDESGRLRLARVSGTEAGAPWARVVALDAGGGVLRGAREGPGAPWSAADLPRDAEAALAAPRCP